MRVYREAGRRTRICSLGAAHSNTLALGKDIEPTGNLRQVNNGYYTEQVAEYVDRQGRTYIARPPISYSSPTRYLRECDKEVFVFPHALPKGSLDIFERPISK